MLNLKLRDEFLDSQTPGTAIILSGKDPSRLGAAQKDPDFILSITYPTADVQTALRAVSAARSKGPIVLMGDRGSGKSHIMAVTHHAIESPAKVQKWANDWGNRLDARPLSELELKGGYCVISEPVHNQEYPLLWELLFDRHPKGDFFRGKFLQMGNPFPPRSLLEDMFKEQPVALILDEFQKWFEGLSDQSGSEGVKYRTWAENFIQILSELSKEQPEHLILVVSLLNNNTEAFRQIHRDSPVLIDFRGPTAREDRKNLVLYRLFDNHRNIPQDEIRDLLDSYASERFRLCFSHLSDSERSRKVSEVIACWPFSPELMELLEDHILMAEAAQEARDLIRVLASSFRARGEEVPIITPADFFVDDDAGGVQSLLDSITTTGNQEKLRLVAQRNLETVKTIGVPAPHARELISALWLRSMSSGRNAGAKRSQLQLDITRKRPIDDNSFQDELTQLIEASINIHGEEKPNGRLIFNLEENPRSKVRTAAKNNKLWQPGVTATETGQTIYPGEDIKHVRETLRHIFSPQVKQTASRVIILGPNWRNDPWSEVNEADMPLKWVIPVLIVIPEPILSGEGNLNKTLGTWLATHVPEKRNTVRFLLPSDDTKSLYQDMDLLFSARCSFLTKKAWKDDPNYHALQNGFDAPLRDALKKRFDKFAVLRRWNFQSPERCAFNVERVSAQGEDIPTAVEKSLIEDHFDQALFQSLVLERAKKSRLVGDLLNELTEPPSQDTKDAIPFLGETPIYEQILKIVAQGKIVINVKGTWITRPTEQTNDEAALKNIQSKAFLSGQEMRQIQLGLPSVVGGTTVTTLGPKPPKLTSPPPTSEDPPPPITNPNPPSIGPTEPAPVSPKPITTKSHRTDEEATGLNLSACFEKWGVESSATLNTAKIEFKNLKVQQVKEILSRLPLIIKASLEVTITQEGDE
ncbi:MAG: hypothetical protein LBT38_05460 [Deltaproteobacteria bacterium]|jgi:hypothetical protein|nr:hypothetical protein [Deltaproteobacteria bacterium]